MAAVDMRTGSVAGQTAAAPKGGKGWQVVRDNFKEFLKHQPAKMHIGAAGAVALLLGRWNDPTSTGPTKEELRDAAQDRLLDNIIAHLNQDTPIGKLCEERWSRARDVNLQVREVLKERNFKGSSGAGSGDDIGRQSTIEACAALFPADWCSVLTEDLLAELVVDSITGSVVDSFLDGAVELLQIHEGWTLPSPEYGASPRRPGGLSKSSSAPGLRSKGALAATSRTASSGMAMLSTTAGGDLAGGSSTSSMQLPGAAPESPQLRPPSVPAVWRQQGRPIHSKPPGSDLVSSTSSSSMGPTDGFATSPGRFSVRGGRGRGQEGDSWTLRRFHACQPLESYTKRIQTFTKQQRPRRRIQQAESDPLGPKFSLPMIATNFPEVWDRTAPPRVKKEPEAPTPGKFDEAEGEWGEEEEEPNGYTWLQRKTRDGQTVFPYSLVSHRAFIESYKDPMLKAKAEEIAPIRLTGNWG